jgi:hypothetical protein
VLNDFTFVCFHGKPEMWKGEVKVLSLMQMVCSEKVQLVDHVKSLSKKLDSEQGRSNENG